MAIRKGRQESSRSLPDSVLLDPAAIAHRFQLLLARQLRAAAASRGPLTSVLPARRSVPPAGVSLSASRLDELRARLARPETVGALVAASFLPWIAHPDALPLAGILGFRELHFDARCPTGVRGTPPIMDFMASGSAGVVGVVACLFGYLGHRPQRLTSAYAALEVPAGLSPWAAYLRSGAEELARFRHVDAAAVAKLAVGLGRIFAGRPARLLYLFLEPEGAEALPCFARHRAELRHLADATDAGALRFVPMSFHELWASWQVETVPKTVRGIAAELARRYAVATPVGPGL